MLTLHLIKKHKTLNSQTVATLHSTQTLRLFVSKEEKSQKANEASIVLINILLRMLHVYQEMAAQKIQELEEDYLRRNMIL